MTKKAISMALALILILSVAVMPVSASGDSFDEPKPISINTEYAGTISDLDNADFYIFELYESGRINTHVVANIYKTDYYLYDVGRAKIWQHELLTWDEASGEAILNEEIDLTAGTYYLVVKQRSGTGSYHFKLDFTSANESFPERNGGANNSIASASPLLIGTDYHGQIALNDKTDFYKFTLSESGAVHMDVTAYIYKTNYFLYDENGDMLWEKTNQTWDDAHEYTLDEYVNLTAGTYYFEVRQYLQTGNYNFKLSFGRSGESFPETEGGVNNEIASASPISLGNTYYGQLALNDATDFYKFTLSGNCKLNLRLTAYIYKTNFYLYDGEGNRVWEKELQTSNPATGELNLEKELELSAGTYYFEVRQYLGTGDYYFSLERANQFTDVSESDFFFKPVLWAVDNGVTGGTSDTTFSPEQIVMRADAMVFFWAASGRPTSDVTVSPFKDVKKKHWAFYAVMWAVEHEITGGTDKTHFSPNQKCTRSEVLQFLYAAMGKPAISIENPYSDVKPKHWYRDGAIWAYERGLERGENGKFKAKTPCTRAYVVTYLYRYFTGDLLDQ